MEQITLIYLENNDADYCKSCDNDVKNMLTFLTSSHTHTPPHTQTEYRIKKKNNNNQQFTMSKATTTTTKLQMNCISFLFSTLCNFVGFYVCIVSSLLQKMIKILCFQTRKILIFCIRFVDRTYKKSHFFRLRNRMRFELYEMNRVQQIHSKSHLS